ncbi:MAG: copper chaperone PCu(A)C [Actinomycetes bacterium]
MNRALRAVTTVVLLISPVALTACSAGRVTQTATQERDKVGALAQVGDITIRAAKLASPGETGYDRGDDADLLMAVINSGTEPDTLVDVTGDGFGDVEFDDGSAAGSSGGSSPGIEIPPGDPVFLDGEDTTVTLTDLDDSLTTGQHLDLTLVFENAGELTIPVTVATPEETVERGEPFDFHYEEGGGGEGAEDTARERESARHN